MSQKICYISYYLNIFDHVKILSSTKKKWNFWWLVPSRNGNKSKPLFQNLMNLIKIHFKYKRLREALNKKKIKKMDEFINFQI